MAYRMYPESGKEVLSAGGSFESAGHERFAEAFHLSGTLLERIRSVRVVALGDNVQSLPDRSTPGRDQRAQEPARARKSPFDNLLQLATEIEHHDDTATSPVLRSVPSPPRQHADTIDRPPPPAGAPVAVVPLPPPPPAPAAHRDAVSARSKENALIVVACLLVAAVASLLLWGSDIEQAVRPSLRSDTGALSSTDNGGDTAKAGDGAEADPTPGAPTASDTTAPPAPAVTDAAAAPQAVPDATVLQATVACDTNSVWPIVEPLNNLAPVQVASVTCLDRYATVVVMPADDLSEAAPTVVIALRADDNAWVPLFSGDPADCVGGSVAADPAFPTSLCG
jgi:hypothetical protein